MNEDELADSLDAGGAAAGRGEAAPGAAGRIRDLLADGSTWAEPAPDGVEDLLAAIAAEPSARPVDVAARPSPPAARRRAGRSRTLVALAAAAALLVVAGVVGLVARSGDGAGRGREVDVAGAELAPDASAVATVEELGSGVAIELDVRGLPPAPPGSYYQGWVKGDDGLVTIGTFHMRGGDDTVDLWSGVPLDEYPTLTVTLQDEGAGQESSGRVVLTGVIGD